MRFSLQTASLRQLVLLSFFLALIPVAVLLWQSHKALTGLSQHAVEEAETSVASVRRAENMQNLVVDIERAIRQHAVVKTAALARVAGSHLDSYQSLLSQVCDNIGQPQLCQQQQYQLSLLLDNFTSLAGNELEPVLQQFRTQQQQLTQQIWVLLEQKLQ